jgi:hypothetical protein
MDVTVAAKGRLAVEELVGAVNGELLEGPLEVHVHVMREHPARDFGTGGSEGLLKESADAYPNMRLGMMRGLSIVHAADGTVWREGAVSALLVTCEWASMNAVRVTIRRAPVATVGDLIRNDLPEAPIVSWSSGA